MPKYPSVTCTLPEFAAWVRWWGREEEKRLLKANRAANPESIRQSIGLLTDAMGRWLGTAEDFAKVACSQCDCTGLGKLRDRKGKKLPCSTCEGHGFIIQEETNVQTQPNAAPRRLRLASPEDQEEEDPETDSPEPIKH